MTHTSATDAGTSRLHHLLLDGLTPEQQAAVCAPTDSHVLVLAAAGSGKTEVLTRRYAWCHLILGIPLERMLCLTFQGSMAAEMAQRAAQWCGATGVIDTAHRVGQAILRRHADHAGLTPTFRIANSRRAAPAWKDAWARIGARPTGDGTTAAIAQAVSLLKQAALTPADLAADPGSVTRIIGAIAGRWTATLPTLYAAYQDALRAQNLADLDDLLLQPYLLLRENPALLAHEADSLSIVLEDEAQDNNAVQFKLFGLLTSRRAQRFTVGDPRQSIFAFRGSRPEYVTRYLTLAAPRPARLCPLNTNFRSTAPILALAAAWLRTTSGASIEATADPAIASAMLSPIRPGRHVIDAPRPRFRAYPNAEAEAADIVATARTLIAAGVEPSDIAVLARTHRLLRPTADLLKRTNMPLTIDPNNFWATDDVGRLLSHAAAAAGVSDPGTAERSLRAAVRYLKADTAAIILHHTGIAGSLAAGIRAILDTDAAAPHERAPLTTLLTNLERWAELAGTAPQMLIATIARDTRALSDTTTAAGLTTADSRADTAAELIAAAGQFRSLSDLLAHRDAMCRPTDAEIRGVRVTTGHAAKGGQWKAVFLPGWEDGTFPSPRAKSTTALQEEARLGYVLLTRAKDLLYISSAQHRTKPTNGTTRWLLKCGEGLVDGLSVPKPPPRKTMLSAPALGATPPPPAPRWNDILGIPGNAGIHAARAAHARLVGHLAPDAPQRAEYDSALARAQAWYAYIGRL